VEWLILGRGDMYSVKSQYSSVAYGGDAKINDNLVNINSGSVKGDNNINAK